MNTILKPKAYAMAFVVFGLFLCSCSPKLNIKNSTFYIAGSPPVMIQVLPRGTEPMNIDPILYSDVLTSSVMTATLQKGIKTQPVGFEGITTPLNPGDVSVNFMNAQIEELEGIPPASNEAEIPESKGYKMTIDYAYTLVGKKGKEITKSFHTIHSITQQELGKRLRKSPDGDPMRVLIEKAALEVVENIEKEVTQQLEKG